MKERAIDVRTRGAARLDITAEGGTISVRIAGKARVYRRAPAHLPRGTPTITFASPTAVPVRRAGRAKGHYILAADFDAPLFDPEDRT